MTFLIPILGPLLLLGLCPMVRCDDVSTSNPQPFSPIVTATCRAGTMTVKVETMDNFLGVVQSRDYRKPKCSSYGENSRITYLRVNLLALPKDDDFCGVFITEDKDEFSVAIAVRVHKTLELAGDKFYMITCGKAGFQNSRNETSMVNLELVRGNEIVQHVVYGQDYTLRAHFTQPDGKFDLQVKRCFSFSNTNNTVILIDDAGCPMPDIISGFKYNRLKGYAEAKLFSMFKFPESNRVHFQCDILVCKGRCPDVICGNDVAGPVPSSLRARALQQEPLVDASLSSSDDGALMASYSVFVLEPGEQVDVDTVCQDCGEINSLVYYLCLAFGILFLVMLIVNVYLCCAMASFKANPCAKASKDKKAKEPISTKPEPFDPYARQWNDGSHYGSRFNTLSSSKSHAASSHSNELTTSSATMRYSLNGAIKPMPVPYIPANPGTSSSKLSPAGSAQTDYASSSARPDSRFSHHLVATGVKSPSRSKSKLPAQSSSSASTQGSRAESTGRLMTSGNHHHRGH